jgi:diguanylate cyclase (GGDEF)-like protein
MATPAVDPRLQRLVELVLELAEGRFDARMEPSDASDDIDAVIIGFHMLAEELGALYEELEARVSVRTEQLAAAHRQLEHRVLHDPLTGLANRVRLLDQIDRAIAGPWNAAARLVVLVIDLDGFKAINDSFGHAVGDELLVEVGRRLRQSVREDDTVARLGGDEFALVVEGASAAQGLAVADRVVAEINAPIEAGGQTCWVTASVGVRMANADDASADVLLRDADTAMYRAKAGGRSGVRTYEATMRTKALMQIRQADELRGAFARGEFLLHYQPIVDLATSGVTAVEALLRWRHPSRGLVSAGRFVPLAEDTGLIVALDRWVLAAAVSQLHEWRDGGCCAAPVRVHVNCSPISFRTPGFASGVLDVLSECEMRPEDMILEITERQMIGEDPQTLQALHSLRSAGVGVAIDDFGTGCASLGYVRRDLVTLVKLDRTLITEIDTDERQRGIAAALLSVVQAFGLDAVGEGVETTAEARELRALGCSFGQGFLWGEPRDAAQTRIRPTG